MLSSVLLLIARLTATFALVSVLSAAFPAAQQIWGYATSCPSGAATDEAAPGDLVGSLHLLQRVLPRIARVPQLDTDVAPDAPTCSKAGA